MKQYYSNPRHDKAAFILASYAPDTIEDIVNLVLSRGSALVNDLAGADGPPRPNAIFSRRFINDLDFKAMYTGALTVQLASLRTVQNDQDFYETALIDAFGIPKQMASVLAKKIETYDILGGLPEEDKRAWYSKMSDRIQETIRQSANWIPSVLQLGIENDQDQKYDIDRLYEFKLLGEAVDDLNSRSRLMTAQAMIAQTMGLFRTAVAKKEESGDIEEGDVDLGYQEVIGDVFRPLMGAPVPLSLMGGFASLANMGKAASTAQAQAAVEDAGLSQAPAKKDVVKNPALRAALTKAMNLSPGKLAMLAGGVAFAPAAVKAIKMLVKGAKGAQAMGDILGDVADKFGEEVAGAMAIGDVMGVLEGINDLSGDIETTGDPGLDEAIIGDVLDEIEAEGGDIEAGDVEIGGVFKRARINAAIRKGNRRQRRGNKKRAKIQRKNYESDQLIKARQFANEAGMHSSDFENQGGGNEDTGSDDQGGGGDQGGGEEESDLSQFN